MRILETSLRINSMHLAGFTGFEHYFFVVDHRDNLYVSLARPREDSKSLQVLTAPHSNW